MKNVVIIGAGIGGLVSAVDLSKKGFKVTIIERHNIVGGYGSNFIRKAKSGEKFNFDVALHGIGDLSKGRVLYEYLNSFGIFEKVKPLRKSETATIMEENNSWFDIPDTFEKFKETFINRFPSSKENIIKLMDFLEKFDKDMELAIKGEKIPEYVTMLSSITLEEFLRQYVDDDEFVEIFGFLWGYYGLPPEELNAYYYLAAWIGYHIGGTFYFEGGGGAFTGALAEVIKENGGELITREEVVKINTKDNKIVSVTTNKNRTLLGDYFIINGCLENVLECVDDKKNIKDYLDKIKDIDSTFSFTQLYIGLDCNPTTLGFTKSDLFAKRGKTNKEAYEHIFKLDYKTTPFVVINYNMLDPNFNKDVGVINVTIQDIEKNWPERDTQEYTDKKEKTKNDILENLYSIFPKLEGHIILTELATPKTMKRYTNNKNGAVYGFCQDKKNGGFKRLGQKTPFNNGYIAGAWTQPGGGFQGAIYSAKSCADMIFSDCEKELNRTVVLGREPIHPKMLMLGMIEDADLSKAKGVKAVYKFNFKDINRQFYIRVYDGKVTYEKNEVPFDTEIVCNYNVWQDIANNYLDGSVALKGGQLVVNGDLGKFAYVPVIFKTPKLKEEKVKKKGIHSNILVPLNLVPWIFYWALHNVIDSSIPFVVVGLIYPLFISPLFKPKLDKYDVTALERITPIAFSIYGLLSLSGNPNAHLFGILLPITFLATCFTKMPLTGQYSKYSYNDYVITTKLFRKLNLNITIIWAIVFTIQFLVTEIIFPNNPLSSLISILNVIAIIYSFLYPRSLER